MITLTIPVDMLRAVSYAAPSKDIRYHLNGVLVEVRNKHLTLVATDGHRLHAGYCGDVSAPDLRLSIPIGTVTTALRTCRNVDKTLALVDLGDEGRRLGDVLFRPVDGRFPDWRQIVPRRTDDAQHLPVLSGEYVADVQKAAAALGGKKTPGLMAWSTNDGSGALLKVDASANFIAVVMGIRRDRCGEHMNEGIAPSWAI